MATSVVPGWQGTVSFTGVTVRAQVLDVQEVIDVNDASGIGTQQRQNVEGMKVLRGSIAGTALIDSTSGMTVTGIGQTRSATGVSFTFTPSNAVTNGVTGTAILSNIRYGKDINGNDALGAQFVSTGPYTVT